MAMGQTFRGSVGGASLDQKEEGVSARLEMDWGHPVVPYEGGYFRCSRALSLNLKVAEVVLWL